VFASDTGDCELRVQVFEVGRGGRFGFTCTAKEGWDGVWELWVMQKQACEFAASVAAYAGDGYARRDGTGGRCRHILL